MAYEREVAERIAGAVARKGAGYVPRTRHRRGDGSARYTNRLILEASPYLLQHAHNPVDWYAWGEEAFAAARKRGVPIFLSIGYSTCHWCHVMEEESFEDEEVARQINEGFVAIKVDREERPDLDGLYMGVVQRFGDGGWPMTVFLLPDRRPFYGGTYFSRGDLSTVLARVRRGVAEEPEKLAQVAEAIVADLRRVAELRTAGDPKAGAIRGAVAQMTRTHDASWGGFGTAPKFPRPSGLELLLRYYRRTGEPAALAAVVRSLEKIAAGGIRDHVGGGFHRYAVDARWKVPHFEKMLYDNAQLAALYAAAYQATGRAEFAEVARDTVEYLLREMRDPRGGFWAASDADTGGVEGATFTWTAAELDAAVGADDGAIVRAVYDVTVGGNFEGGRNILWRPDGIDGLDDVATRLALPVERVREALRTTRETLRTVRARRAQPAIDRKVLVAWNGLAISALAKVGFILDEPRYVAAARETAAYLLAHARSAPGGPDASARSTNTTGAPVGRSTSTTASHGLTHAIVDGVAGGTAFLDDTALLAAGLLDLYEADPDPRWLREAIALQAGIDASFADPRGGYYLTGGSHEALLARDRPDRDDPLPSGNAVAVANLLRLAELTTDEAYRARAMAALRSFPLDAGMPAMLAALDFALDRPKQIVLVGGGDGEPAPLLAQLRTAYTPNRILVRVPGDAVDERARLIPLVEGKRPQKGLATAYVCVGSHCEQPTSDPETLRAQLLRADPLDPPPSPAAP
ncbi:MAG: thioredoxin domain-containing protein [Deltaproteobacteria bacterium]|nr:thioredoxin domain-containing protein [Deltaproteobacteria bacterium]